MTTTTAWQPTAEITTLRKRAEIVAEIRQFFVARGVFEVETPLLSASGTVDEHIQSMSTETHSPAYRQGKAWLHTSPEFAMKRLLCAGSGDIFQLCKVFRAEELGSRHNPEFTLLEWYRLDYDMLQLMAEVDCLIKQLAESRLVLGESLYLSYQQAFESYAGLTPRSASFNDVVACLRSNQIDVPRECSKAELLDLVMALVVEPQLPEGTLVFIYHYPAEQAALAKLCPDDPTVACRFEVFLNGVELANGFEELQDAAEQAARFNRELEQRVAKGLDNVPVDQNFLAGLAAGLPACAGVAVGVDRLVMALLGEAHIQNVISFPADNA